MTRKIVSCAAAAIAVLWGSGAALADPPYFVGLGNVTLADLAADGSAAVGWSPVGPDRDEAFRWTRAGGLQPLGFLPGHNTSYAESVSGDGEVVLGISGIAGDPTSGIYFRWTPSGGMTEIELPSPCSLGGPSRACLSFDGSQFYICMGGEKRPIGKPAGAFDPWRSVGVAEDGLTAVVRGYDATAWQSFFWTAAGGWEPVGGLPGGLPFSFAQAISADGRYIVGSSGSALAFSGEAYLRDTRGGLIGLGDPPGGGTGYSEAYYVSRDGTVVLGVGDAGEDPIFQNPTAALWTDPAAGGAGMRSVKQILETDYGFDLTGLVLRVPDNQNAARQECLYGAPRWLLSDDGRTLAGHHSTGHTYLGPWVAHLGDLCYADCDGSGSLDFFDFLCFQNLFAAGDPLADCDESGELDFFDFLCFQNQFAAGCP